MKSDVRSILQNWGICHADIVENFETHQDKIVCKIKTEIGTIVLKGQPASSKEDFIIGNIKAHEFLGNLHHMAPKILYKPDGTTFLKNENYYFYLMEFVEGRKALETLEDERLLGHASAKLHQLSGYQRKSTYDTKAIIKQAKDWFSEYTWKTEFDEILAALPDFDKYKQCFIHTDIGPHNTIIRGGSIVFIDLDDAGIGSKHIDIGYPFIAQFVSYNKATEETHYKFDAAKAFLEGYNSVCKISRLDYDLIWSGAVLRFISEMQCYGEEAVEPLWHILKFGLQQKDKLLQAANFIV